MFYSHALRSPCAALALCFSLSLGATPPLLGCSSTVEVTRGDGAGPPAEGGAPCPDPVKPAEQGPAAVELRGASEGTFVGDHLHLSARLSGDSEERYMVIEIQDDAAFVVAVPEELRGPAQLLPMATHTFARLRELGDGGSEDGEPGEWQVEIIDTSSPRAPAHVANFPLPGVVPAKWRRVLSIQEGRLFFCLQTQAGFDPELATLDLESGDLGSVKSTPCRDIHDGGFASGPRWLSWITGGGVQASQLRSFGLSLAGVTEGFDWGYNPSGISGYGVIRSAAADGDRVVLDPSSEDWFLVFTGSSVPAQGPYKNFGLPGPKRLLTVAAETAYFATPDGVHAYDLSDLGAPLLTDYHAAIALDPAQTSFIARSDRYLVITDGEGRLYLVPRDRSGEVAPAKVFLGPPAATSTKAPACED